MGSLPSPWRRHSTTGDGNDSRRFRIVHPFHPLTGREFELVGYGHTWGENRVFYRERGSELVRSLPASWTDVDGPDPFIVLGEGRSCFRVDDLLVLAGLLGELLGREKV